MEAQSLGGKRRREIIITTCLQPRDKPYDTILPVADPICRLEVSIRHVQKARLKQKTGYSAETTQPRRDLQDPAAY